MRFGHGSKPLPTASTQPPNLQYLLNNLNARMMNANRTSGEFFFRKCVQKKAWKGMQEKTAESQG
jgi:hypothetical protein